MADSLYALREAQNDLKFDQLALTLQQFRTTVDRDIHGQITSEQLLLDQLNENFLNMMEKVKRSGGNLRTVMSRNASLSRVVFVILGIFIVIWLLYHL